MYQELTQINTVKEIKEVFSKKAEIDLFTENELKSVENKNKLKSLGARYLIKKLILESIAVKNQFRDIEIFNDSKGKPFVSFIGKVKGIIENEGIISVQVSISHSRNYVTALVLIEKDV